MRTVMPPMLGGSGSDAGGAVGWAARGINGDAPSAVGVACCAKPLCVHSNGSASTSPAARSTPGIFIYKWMLRSGRWFRVALLGVALLSVALLLFSIVMLRPAVQQIHRVRNQLVHCFQ